MLMTLLPGLSFAVISGLISLSTSMELRRADYTATCQDIAASVSSASKVHYNGQCIQYLLPEEGLSNVKGRPNTLRITSIGLLPVLKLLHAPLSLRMLRMSELLQV
jgi:hypothetical protein